jgi:hypothetical protein
MKIAEVTQKQPIAENASVGATASSAIATSIPGGGAGFGNSIFMKRNPTKKKRTK